MRNTHIGLACIGSIAVIGFGYATIVLAKPVETALEFATHPQASFPEQDVYVLRSGSPQNMVYRVEADKASDAAILGGQAYTSAEPVEHDPFMLGPSPLGPFPRGTALGFTLGDWLKAAGRGTYTVDGNRAALDLSFENLVHRGVYTVWCSRLKLPPDPSVVDMPCGAPDGSENKLTAGADGTAHFTLTMNPLLPSSEDVLSVVALAYHSDGKTYGVSPGEFGSKTHVQIFSMIPAAPVSTGGAVGDGQVLLWVIVGILIVLIIVHLLTKSEMSKPLSTTISKPTPTNLMKPLPTNLTKPVNPSPSPTKPPSTNWPAK